MQNKSQLVEFYHKSGPKFPGEAAEKSCEFSLTSLSAKGGVPVRKVMDRLRDGRVTPLKGYPGVRLWRRGIVRVARDIDALGAAIAALAAESDTCIVTGAPCGETPLEQFAPRLKHPRPDAPATLAEASAPWLPVDLDKVPLEHPLDPFDPEAAVASVVERLGEPFANASYVWQLTGSASPAAVRLSMRLFFLIDRAIDNAERKAWALALNRRTGTNLVDAAIYSAAQPIYTAAPEFRGVDPFPRRVGVTYGEAEFVDWSRVDTAAPQAGPEYAGAWAGGTHRSIAAALAAIGDGPGQEGFHTPIREAVWRMVWQKWTPERIALTIRATVFAADSSRHDHAYLLQETSDRALLASIKGAARRIKASENRPRATRTAVAEDAVTLPEAEARIRELVRKWAAGEGPSRLVLSATVGCGKTFQTVRALLAELTPERRFLWAFPTHRQGEEVLQQFNAGGEVAVRIEGRVREGEDIGPLCARPRLIQEIQQAGLARHTATIACERGSERCPHRSGCAYYRQFAAGPLVRLVPHALLAHPAARAWSGEFAGAPLVIDESPLAALTGSKSFRLEAVMDAGGVLADVIEAFRTGSEVDAEATAAALEAEMAARCVVDIPLHGPGAADEGILVQELVHAAQARRPSLLPLYRAAIARLQGDKNVLWFSKDGDDVWTAWRHELPPEQRVLVLDATASEEVYRALLGEDVRIERIAVRQNLRVVQAHDVPVGKGRLLDPKGDLLAQAVALARGLGAGVISNKPALAAATDRGWLPDGYAVGHFNALRGLNAMAQLKALVIAGRPEPDPLALERIARALWPRAALALTGSYVWAQDGVASVASHPDPRCDELLRTLRESEIAQAIGRLRAVRSSEEKLVILLTHTPIGLPVEARALEEIVLPAKLAKLLLAGHGVAPLVPALMAAMLPEEWANPKAAEDWLRRDLKPALPLDRCLYKRSAGFKFRTAGQRRASSCLSWLPIEEAGERLEQLTGREVVDCRRVEPPAPRPTWTQPTFTVTRYALQPPEAAPEPPRPWAWEKPAFTIRTFAEAPEAGLAATTGQPPPRGRRGPSPASGRSPGRRFGGGPPPPALAPEGGRSAQLRPTGCPMRPRPASWLR